MSGVIIGSAEGKCNMIKVKIKDIQREKLSNLRTIGILRISRKTEKISKIQPRKNFLERKICIHR